MSYFSEVEINKENNFETVDLGYYVILVTAKASAWWQNFPQFIKRFFQDDNLSVVLDNFPIELKWNGNNLKGAKQTNVFLARLRPRLHFLKFKKTQTPVIIQTKIYKLSANDPDLVGILPAIEKDGDRRPLFKFALIRANANKLFVKATVLVGRKHRLFQQDDDDLKLRIDGQVVRNDLPKSHNEWYWCGRAQSYIGTTARTLEKQLATNETILLEFDADRLPKIEALEIFLSKPTKPSFDKLLVVSDEEFLGLQTTQDEIGSFLERNSDGHPGHLFFKKFDGETPVKLIFEACQINKINPKIILTKLQTEQGLITGDKSIKPTQKQLDGALGVGMLDDGTVLQEYQGFAKQIKSAAETFRSGFDSARREKFEISVDGATLAVNNSATYSLYSYTPHVSGAKLFFDTYYDFFGL